MARLARLWDSLLNALTTLVSALVGVLVLAIVFEVVARYFFNSPTIWAVDLVEYGMVYLTFFGAVWVLRQRSHVRVDILVSRLSPRRHVLVEGIGYVVAALIMAVFAYMGAEATWQAFTRNELMIKAWLVPVWPTRLPIALGSLMLTVEALRQAGISFAEWRTGDVEAEGEHQRAIL